ncbi:MAG: DNA-binding protein WhiA [Actinobacteria bacterium]|nr:DNA-binding protein WhiA [Actinomycetota bacterium]
MAMTASVKDELSRLSVTKPCCRKAEVSAILRFAGGLHLSAGKVMVEIELDTAQAARRVRKDIADIYGHDSDLAVISAGGLRKGSRYLVRVINEAGQLRITHGQASLEELGSLSNPPMTKDAIAGRIRRLLAMADKRAHDLGIPDTEAGLSPDLLN